MNQSTYVIRSDKDIIEIKQNCVRTLAQYIIDDLINEQNIFIHFCLDNWDQKRRSRKVKLFEPVHEISNNLVCATSKASDQPAHTRSLIRAFASRLSIL